MEINARKLFILKHGHFLKSDRLKALLAHVAFFDILLVAQLLLRIDAIS